MKLKLSLCSPIQLAVAACMLFSLHRASLNNRAMVVSATVYMPNRSISQCEGSNDLNEGACCHVPSNKTKSILENECATTPPPPLASQNLGVLTSLTGRRALGLPGTGVCRAAAWDV